MYTMIKRSVYSNDPHTIDDLKMTITEYILNADRAVPNTVFENTVRRVNKCLETGGGHENITCNFLYCNHQAHIDFFDHSVYKPRSEVASPKLRPLGRISSRPHFKILFFSDYF
jgi:hypothetical protein